MGWKTFKQVFGINDHLVEVTHEGVCIGTKDAHNLAVISLTTGDVIKGGNDWFLNLHYPGLLMVTAEEVLEALRAEDVFERSIPVYTFEGGEIIEQLCETPGHPNLTHAGQMMFDTTHSTDKNEVIEWAKNACLIDLRRTVKDIALHEQDIARLKSYKDKRDQDYVRLLSEYPDLAGL